VTVEGVGSDPGESDSVAEPARPQAAHPQPAPAERPVVRPHPADLADPAVREAVLDLLAEGVRGGAALGWLEPPPLGEVNDLLDDLARRLPRDAGVRMVREGPRVVALGFWRRYDRPSLAANADLEKVLVAGSRRGRGLGRAVVEGLVEDAGRAGVEALTLDVRGDNLLAIALYERLGFAECGRVRDFVAWGGRRFDRVTMQLRLAPTGPGGEQHAVATHLVGWMVLQRPDGRVLLGRRSGVAYANGRWGLPGGHAVRGETWAAAAVRETREEIGVLVDEADLEPLGVSRYDDEGLQGVDVFFLARRWRGDPAPIEECSEVDWFDPSELPADSLPWLGHALRTHLLDRRWLDDAAAQETPGGAAG
jgi:8-oxo-dGTP diphosphatase